LVRVIFYSYFYYRVVVNIPPRYQWSAHAVSATVECSTYELLSMPSTSATPLVDGRVPDGWTSPWFGADLGMNWAELLPAASDR
jgi:hypothetical protein